MDPNSVSVEMNELELEMPIADCVTIETSSSNVLDPNSVSVEMNELEFEMPIADCVTIETSSSNVLDPNSVSVEMSEIELEMPIADCVTIETSSSNVLDPNSVSLEMSEMELEMPIADCVTIKTSSSKVLEASSVRNKNDSESEDEPYIAPPHLVQMTSTKAEVEQMINSFIAGRRARINQLNIREFCGPDYNGESCARVSAVHFTKRLLIVEDADNYWEKFKRK